MRDCRWGEDKSGWEVFWKMVCGEWLILRRKTVETSELHICLSMLQSGGTYALTKVQISLLCSKLLFISYRESMSSSSRSCEWYGAHRHRCPVWIQN